MDAEMRPSVPRSPVTLSAGMAGMWLMSITSPPSPSVSMVHSSASSMPEEPDGASPGTGLSLMYRSYVLLPWPPGTYSFAALT